MQSTAQKGNAQEAVYTYRFVMKGRPPVPNAFNVQLFVDNTTCALRHLALSVDRRLVHRKPSLNSKYGKACHAVQYPQGERRNGNGERDGVLTF